MYNSKKTSGDMEPSQVPLRKPNSLEQDKDTGNKLTDYKMICELGRGSYGVVNRVLSLVNGNEYVLKKINMKHVKLNHQKEALKEAQILKKVRHTNIIKYYTSFVEDDHLYIIMEYAESGDLAALIKSHKEKRKPFTEKQIWDFAWELCQALDYLHNNNIIHRDIKALNVFLSKEGHVKLGDLGVSKIVSSAAALHGTRVGTPLYLSPELVKQLPYDCKVDIWALGCVLYHLATLEAPFTGDNLISLGYNIVHKPPKPLSSSYSPKLTSLIMKFLEKNPTARPKLSEIWGYFPSKYRNGSKDKSEGNENNLSNKVEYHNKSAAQLLKIDDKDLLKNKVDKPITHWGVGDKKSDQLPLPTRPQTASHSHAHIRNVVAGEERNSKLNLGSQLLPEKINVLSHQNDKNRPGSPVRQTPGLVANFLAEAINVNGLAGENESQVKRGSLIVNNEKRMSQFVNENNSESKLRTVQNVSPTIYESNKQTKDTGDVRRVSKKEELNIVMEEKPIEKKVSQYRQSPSADLSKPLNNQPDQQNKGVKDHERRKTHVTETSPKRDQKQGDQDKEQHPVRRDYNSNGPLQRPQTADARKILMKPLISSSSPRFKINNKLSQIPSLQTNLSKPSNDGLPHMLVRPQTAQHRPVKNDITESKDNNDDSIESIEVLEDLKKKSHSDNANSASGIRIRPVSAHILKSMQNNLGSQVANSKAVNKENKSVVEKEVNLKTDISKPKITEGSKEDVDSNDRGNSKTRTTSVERPKSALVGRLAPKGLQLQKDQGSFVGRNHPAFEVYVKPGYAEGAFGKNQGSMAIGPADKEKEKISKFFPISDKKQTEVLKEECEDFGVFDDDDRRSTYKEFWKRNTSASSSVRFEILGKSMLKNSVDVTRKTETTATEWNTKEDKPKGAKDHGGFVRPMTAVASSKKKLTIHDLM